MDYYESDRPQIDDGGLSGSMGYNFQGQYASPVVQNIESSAIGGQSFGSPANTNNIFTITVCVNGVPNYLDVFAAGNPYPVS